MSNLHEAQSAVHVKFRLSKLHIPPFSYQVIPGESLPLAQVLLGLRGAKLGWGRKNLIKMLTLRQLTLQCCHHSLTQCHSPPPQFIQNQAFTYRPSHRLYARYYTHKRYAPNASETNIIFLWLTIVFSPIWTSKQRNRKWKSSLLSSEGSSFWNQFQFGCVFRDNKSRVCETRASFCGMECVVPSKERNRRHQKKKKKKKEKKKKKKSLKWAGESAKSKYYVNNWLYIT